ncbi:MAG: ribosomal protein S18-alanine N-acetyltransferase [Myxococcota bacterium]|nr:ribosomal protein S18-alanine N-acetyltransferase [Myxococcota bacterium]
MPPSIGPAHQSDLDAIAEIEAVGMQGGWSRAQLAEELDNPRSHLLVARAPAGIQGHAVAWVVADEVHIQTVCVHPQARRQGLGRALVQALLETATGPALLEVRASNTPAITLYSRLGFQQVGRRPRYYADGEDALLMTLERP